MNKRWCGMKKVFISMMVLLAAGTILAESYVNGKKVAEGRIDRTQPRVFSADETADVGIDLATPVVETIGSEARSRFTGTVNKVTIKVKPMKPMKPGKKAEVDNTLRQLAHRKAMAD